MMPMHAFPTILAGTVAFHTFTEGRYLLANASKWLLSNVKPATRQPPRQKSASLLLPKIRKTRSRLYHTDKLSLDCTTQIRSYRYVMRRPC